MRERDRLERELRDSEIRYRTLASSSPDLVFATDAEGRYTFLSDRARTMLGWDIDAMLGTHFGAYVAPGWEAAAGASFADIVADPGTVHTSRIDFLRGDGSPIPLEINVVGSQVDGRLSAIHGVARDISERERLEHELQASEARFRNLVQTSPDVIYRCDAEGRFLFMAEGSEALFGWTPAEVAGKTFADFTAEESLAEALANFEIQQTEHDVVRRFRYLVRHRDGTTFPAEITSVSVWEDGQFAGVQGTVRDISEQERLERELRESQERYRFLVENSPDVVFSTDARGQVHVHVRSHGADDRLAARRTSSAAISPRSSSPPASPEAADPLGGARRPTRRPSRSRTSTSRDPTAGSSRSRSARSAWSTPRAGSPASTARRATSASGPAWSASCANPRSATATSSPRRRTSSG